MTTKQRCRQCSHRRVCPFKDHYANVEDLGEKCNYFNAIRTKSNVIKFKDILNLIGEFADFQLFSSKTAKALTYVTYYEGTSEREVIDSYLNCIVIGIHTEMYESTMTNEGQLPYLAIVIKD